MTRSARMYTVSSPHANVSVYAPEMPEPPREVRRLARLQGSGQAFRRLAVARGHAQRGAVGEDVDVEGAERAGTDVGEFDALGGQLLQGGHRALVVADGRRLHRDEVGVRGVPAAGGGQFGGLRGSPALDDVLELVGVDAGLGHRLQRLQAHEVRLPGHEDVGLGQAEQGRARRRRRGPPAPPRRRGPRPVRARAPRPAPRLRPRVSGRRRHWCGRSAAGRAWWPPGHRRAAAATR